MLSKNIQYQQSLFVREHEGMTRGRFLGRLSYVIMCGEQDQYVRFLPQIKELVVESFKVPHTPILQAQAYLCLRAIVLKFSQQHLISFLPVVFTELIATLMTMPLSGTPFSQDVLLGACKLIETLLLLPDFNFSLYRYLFIPERADLVETTTFLPFITRVELALNKKFPVDKQQQQGGGDGSEEDEQLGIPMYESLIENGAKIKPLITMRSIAGDRTAVRFIQKLINKYPQALFNDYVSMAPLDVEAVSQLIYEDLTYQFAKKDQGSGSTNNVSSSQQNPQFTEVSSFDPFR